MAPTKHNTNMLIMTLLLLVVLSSSVAIIGAKIADREERKLINLPPPGTKTRVRIINELGPGASLAVHCKSKDDDLGSQTLAPHQNFDFFFKPNWIGSTLFFCHVEWPGTGNSHFFDAYISDRDRDRCGLDCCWNLKPAGPCDCYSGKCLPWNAS